VTWNLAVRCALIGVLAVLGWRVFRLSPKTNTELAEIARADRLRLQFSKAIGVGAFGELIDSEHGEKTPTLVGFVLRAGSFESDLAFWQDVSRQAVVRARTKLVGYCDSPQCLDDVRRTSPKPEFPIIGFGEVGATQALLNADLKSECIVVDFARNRSTKIEWRGSNPQLLAGRLQ
jgi:hypothetical protein